MAVKKDFTPWEYQKGNSFLHRLPGGVKLLGLLALSTGAFFSGLIALGCLAFFLFALAICARIKPWELLRGSLPLIIFVLAVIAFGSVNFSSEGIKAGGLINYDALREGLVFSARMALSYSAGSLFFRVCTIGEIKRALSRVEKLPGFGNLRIALSLSLMMGFLPKFFAIWEDLKIAWDSRSGRGGFFWVVKMLPVVIGRLMGKAAETAEALESRSAL